MSEKTGSEQLKENLKNKHSWFRFIWIVVCVFLFMIASALGLVVVIASTIALLVTGERQENLSKFGGQLASYLKQLGDYATLNREQMPFPLDDWPASEQVEQSPPTPPKKTAAKKTTARKTTQTKTAAAKKRAPRKKSTSSTQKAAAASS